MDAIVIGAGPAGLATAACLLLKGSTVQVLERADAVGASWRAHYNRLHLHTARGRSGLPHHPMPTSFGRYPSRADVIAYLEDYAAHFDIAPRLGTEVRRVTPEGDGWTVTHDGGRDTARTVVFATGLNGTPHHADPEGLDSFPGPILHSSAYREPSDLPGGRILVVGFGNSGGEIALDLAEAGAEVTLSVRGPVNILPREMFGMPITSLGLLRKLLGYRAADRLSAPLLRARIGRPETYGLQPAGKGPIAQVVEDGRIPLIDIGTLDAIRAGRISVRPGIGSIEGPTVTFTDGTAMPFDAILMATGYRVDLRPLLPESRHVLDPNGRPRISGGDSGAPGLFFCSYHASAEGQLRQSGIEAQAIAELIATRLPA